MRTFVLVRNKYSNLVCLHHLSKQDTLTAAFTLTHKTTAAIFMPFLRVAALENSALMSETKYVESSTRNFRLLINHLCSS